jgi:hypothetical protein
MYRKVSKRKNPLKNTIFWDITTCRPLKVNRRFRGTSPSSSGSNKSSKIPVTRFATCFQAGILLSLFDPRAKMEAICSSEMSVDFQRTILHYIPEDSTLHKYGCEYLKSDPRNLCLQIDNHLNWRNHVDKLVPQLSGSYYAVRSLLHVSNTDTQIYFAYFCSLMKYGIIWGDNSLNNKNIFVRVLFVLM